MENASRALMMAGSILISIIVISALVFAFRELAGTKNTEINSERLQEIKQFNQTYESYNDKIYGKQLIALAQRMDDYNQSINTGNYNSSSTTSAKGKNGYNYIVLEVSDGGTKTISNYVYIHDFIEDNFGKGKTYSSVDNFNKYREALDVVTNPNANENSKEYEKAVYTINELEKRSVNKSEYSSLKNKADNIYTNGYELYEKVISKQYRCVDVVYSETSKRIEKMEFKVE